MNQTHAQLLKVGGFSVTGDCGPFTFYTDKRKNRVAFLKSPPLTPPSALQSHRRNQFRAAGWLWRAVQPSTRAAWREAARRANLSITAYNLWVYYWTTKRRDIIATIEAQTGISLLPP